MLRLLLARHGQTEWNVEGRYQGWGDSPLTARGLAEAELLGRRLAEERIDAAYASDCERAWRTAEIAVAGRGLTVQRDPAWREMGYGRWEGHTPREVRELWPELHARRGADPENVGPPDGETRLQLRDRVLGALERLRQEHAGERVLVVTHGGCLALLGSWLHTGGVSEPQPYLSVNCGLSAVGWLEDAHAVEFWNDGSHLAERNPA